MRVSYSSCDFSLSSRSRRVPMKNCLLFIVLLFLGIERLKVVGCQVNNLFTTGLAEAVFVYYRAGRGADKPVGWLIYPEGFAPESPVAGDRAHKRP